MLHFKKITGGVPVRHKKSLFFVILLSSLTLGSCTFLQKVKDRFKKKPEIEGAELVSFPENIENSNLGSDSQQLLGLNSVYFDLNGYSLKESVKETLRSNKEWIDNNSNVKQVVLEGHCDPLGSEAYNIGLGERRAQAVYNYLLSLGLSPDKMSLISYGEEKPISEVDNALNRRVNFVPQY